MAPIGSDHSDATSTCQRCGEQRWDMHCTWVAVRIGERSFNGYLPLCEPCWAALAPAERLSYYRALFLSGGPGPHELGQWFEIERAVLEER